MDEVNTTSMIIDLVKRLEVRLDNFESKLDSIRETMGVIINKVDKTENGLLAIRNESIPRIYSRIEEIERELNRHINEPLENAKGMRLTLYQSIVSAIGALVVAGIIGIITILTKGA